MIMVMYQEGFWLSCFLAVAVCLISSVLVCVKSLKKKKTNSTTIVASTAEKNNNNTESLNSPSYDDANLPGGEYEVFLSFRGPDTRYGFTDYLYNDLKGAQVRTFRDDNELRKGEEIGPELLKAIKESKISIPIFSKGYASSKWCLRELAKMVECKDTMQQMIKPIFYDVEPSDVRHQTGSYAEAFRQHKKDFDKKTVDEWKEALRKVGALKGWDLRKDTNGHQGKLVKEVVSAVLLELKKNYMDVTKDLVGIKHHVEEMMRLLNVDSNDVRIIGIHGMGGLGKTTIAKFIYNQLFKSFECCSFLSDVRETSQQLKGLVDLQNKLISNILKQEYDRIKDVDVGIQRINDTVCRKKALIVLDDVDQKSQFDKLAGKRDSYGSGSRIIITTRNKEILEVLEVDAAYEPPEMEPDHSLQLFSKHAFHQDFPPKDYESLSKEVASTAAGLPLALEITGSGLFRKERTIWIDTLKKLKKIPNDQVLEKLRVTYDKLDHEQKQIFLDIACLFVEVEKEIPFYMWDDYGFYPRNGINVLILTSFIKIGDDNKFRMHDQLRGLGRKIVREENSEPRKRSRLWSHKEALYILERGMGTEKVHALRLELERDPQTMLRLTNKEFKKLSYLRFLQVDGAELTGDFKHLLSDLRWLSWRRCPGSFTAINFHLKKLVILDLSFGYITNDWDAWSQIKMATKLKVLNLSDCEGLIRTPDLSTFTSLERLILINCRNMVHIDPSIESLINLKVLDISYSTIRELPEAIGNLEKLEEINAAYSKLQREIPSTIGMLSSLRILKLNGTKIQRLPTSICRLSWLQSLDLLSCSELQWLPELPPSLEYVCVTSRLMKTLPSMSNMMNLEVLNIIGCSNLVELPKDIGKLCKLKSMLLSRTKISTLPAELGTVSHLKTLIINSCENLQCIQGLPSSLFRLHLVDCEPMESLPDLSEFKSLSELRITHCCEFRGFQGLGKLESLTILEVSWCEKLAELDGLERLESLRYFDTAGCISLERLPDLSNLKELRKLIIKKCSKLIEIPGLDRLKSLEHLDMNDSISIERLPGLSNLKMMKELNCCACEKLVEADGLRVSKSLEKLDMSRCKSFEKLPDLSSFKNLKELRIRGWECLTETQGLGELDSLEVLIIGGCKSIEKLPDLSNLKKLKKLIADGCEKLAEIQGLENLISFQLLEITGCKSLEKIPDLPNTKIRQHSPNVDLWEYGF